MPGCDVILRSFNLSNHDIIEVSAKARICGRQYSKGNVVILRKNHLNRGVPKMRALTH